MFKENFYVGLLTYFDEVLLVHEGEVEGAVARCEAEDAGLLIALEPLAGPLQVETFQHDGIFHEEHSLLQKFTNEVITD